PSDGGTLQNQPLASTDSPVQVLAMSANGRFLAGGDDNGGVTIWDSTRGDIVLRLQENAPVGSLAFSPDGQTLAMGFERAASSAADTVRLRKIARGELTGGFGHEGASALAWFADGRLAAGFEDGTLLLRDAAGGEPRPLFTGDAAIGTLDFHPNGRVL